MAATIKRDDNKRQWEDTEFPLVCETCLGDNAYIRMTREAHAKRCRICDTPCTLFSWQAGTKGRLKKVEICRNCAQAKNVCQVCIYDLQYGLPVKVRDRVLKEAGSGGASATAVPMSHANRAWFAAQQARLIEQGDGNNANAANALAHAQLQSIARMEPRYERNLPKLCTFYARGECNRGSDCPFRHEMPRDRNDPLSRQNTRDRFHGTNDPVAARLWAKLIQKKKDEEASREKQQNDGFEKAKSTLYLRFEGEGPYQTLAENAIRDQFYSFGEIVSVRIQAQKGQAFVEFTQPEACEWAISANHRKTLLGRKILVAWARIPKRGNPGHDRSNRKQAMPLSSRGASPSGTGTASSSQPSAAPLRPSLPPSTISKKPLPKGLTAAKPPPSVVAARSSVPRPGGGVIRGAGMSAAKATVGSTKPYYPSADPTRLGSKTNK